MFVQSLFYGYANVCRIIISEILKLTIERDGLLMAEVNPFIKDAVVQFQTGALSLKQIEAIFNVLPFDIDFIDVNDRFKWFSNKPNREHVRSTSQLQDTLQQLHPGTAAARAQAVIDSFKKGEKQHVEIPLNVDGKLIDINYYAVRDNKGEYLGTIEYTGTINHLKELIDQGAWKQDVTTGASKDGETHSSEKGDAVSGASRNEKAHSEKKSDATTGPSRLSMKDDRWIP